jgi:hypothetical protein
MTGAPGESRPGDDHHRADSTPPGGGRWIRWYALVIGWLIVQIVLYWLFTKAFA